MLLSENRLINRKCSPVVELNFMGYASLSQIGSSFTLFFTILLLYTSLRLGCFFMDSRLSYAIVLSHPFPLDATKLELQDLDYVREYTPEPLSLETRTNQMIALYI